jgi:hypothetical protein
MTKTPKSSRPERRPARPTLTFDYQKYQPMLDDPSLSEEQKRQMLEALWSLITGFVDLGFAIDPAEETCGQLPGPAGELGFAAKSVPNCKDAFTAQITLQTQKGGQS